MTNPDLSTLHDADRREVERVAPELQAQGRSPTMAWRLALQQRASSLNEEAHGLEASALRAEGPQYRQEMRRVGALRLRAGELETIAAGLL